MRATLLGLALLVGAMPAAAQPRCVEECRELAERGELRTGISQKGCEVRVCQERARTLYRQARYAEALDALEFVRPRLEKSAAYNLDLGLVLYALGRHEEAVEAFDVVMLAFPDSVRGGAQRGHALLRLHRFDEALKDFEDLREKPGAEAEFKGLATQSYLLGNIGVVKLLKGDLPGGRAGLAEALELDGRNRLAATYLHDVIPEFESGVLDDDDLFNLVAAYEEIGLQNYERAAVELDRLTRGAPEFALGYTLQGDVLRRTLSFSECEEALLRGQKAVPDNPDLRAQRIRCTLLRAGPTSEEAAPALAELRTLREQYPDNRLIEELLLALDR